MKSVERAITLGLFILVCILLSDRCNKPVEKPVNEREIIEKLFLQKENASLKRQDSLIKLLIILTQDKDSLRILHQVAASKLNQAQKTSARLAANVQLSKLRNDTTGFVQSCDSLSTQ